jgi:hypothetical protein
MANVLLFIVWYFQGSGGVSPAKKLKGSHSQRRLPLVVWVGRLLVVCCVDDDDHGLYERTDFVKTIIHIYN